MDHTENHNPKPTIKSGEIKLPPFLLSNARLWFRIADFELCRDGIRNEHAMYRIAKANLCNLEKSQVTSEQWQRIEEFSTNAPYTQLKSFLVEKCKQSKTCAAKKQKKKRVCENKLTIMFQSIIIDSNNNQSEDSEPEDEKDTDEQNSSGPNSQLVQQLATELNNVSIDWTKTCVTLFTCQVPLVINF